MLNIQSDELSIEVLDPIGDRDRLGTRFCTGGQIYQVHDREHGPLLAGPTYPDDYNTFDSQGLPDGFTVYPGFEDCRPGDSVMAIGVGLARYSHPVKDLFARANREVAAWVDWEGRMAAGLLTFETGHRFGPDAYELRRRLAVDGRAVSVVSELTNHGDRTLPLHWFAHPFFPFPPGGVAGRMPCAFMENAAFGRGENGEMILRYTPEVYRPEAHDTFVEGVPEPTAESLVIPVRHALVGTVEVECRFPVASLPCWYNDRTFSPEPYRMSPLPPDESAEWEIVYRF